MSFQMFTLKFILIVFVAMTLAGPTVNMETARAQTQTQFSITDSWKFEYAAQGSKGDDQTVLDRDDLGLKSGASKTFDIRVNYDVKVLGYSGKADLHFYARSTEKGDHWGGSDDIGIENLSIDPDEDTKKEDGGTVFPLNIGPEDDGVVLGCHIDHKPRKRTPIPEKSYCNAKKVTALNPTIPVTTGANNQYAEINDQIGTADVGETVTAKAKMEATGQATDNIVYGVLATQKEEVIDVQKMSGTGGGTVELETTIPDEARGDGIYFHIKPVTSTEEAKEGLDSDSKNAVKIGQTSETGNEEDDDSKENKENDEDKENGDNEENGHKKESDWTVLERHSIAGADLPEDTLDSASDTNELMVAWDAKATAKEGLHSSEEIATVLVTPDVGESAALSSDGTLIAYDDTAKNGVVNIRDIGNGETEAIDYFKNASNAKSLAFSPDDTRLSIVLGGSDKRGLVVHDVQTGNELRRNIVTEWAAKGTAFSADGKYVSWGSGRGVVRIINTATGRVTGTVGGILSRSYDQDFSPNYLAHTSGHGVYVYELPEFKRISNRINHFEEGGNRGISFSGNGTFLAYRSGTDVVVRETYGWSKVATLRESAGKVSDIEFAGSEKIAYSDSKNDRVYVHKVEGKDEYEEKKPENESPVAADDSYTIYDYNQRELDVLDNDSDPDGSQSNLSLQSVGDPKHGNTSTDYSGTEVRYKPGDNFSDTDSFTYTVRDEQGATATATVNLKFAQGERKYFVAEGSSTTSLHITDRHPDFGQDFSLQADNKPPHHYGSGNIEDTGKDIQYNSYEPFYGTDTFTYTLTDNKGNSETVIATVGVLPPDLYKAVDGLYKGTSDSMERIDSAAKDLSGATDYFVENAEGDPASPTATLLTSMLGAGIGSKLASGSEGLTEEVLDELATAAVEEVTAGALGRLEKDESSNSDFGIKAKLNKEEIERLNEAFGGTKEMQALYPTNPNMSEEELVDLYFKRIKTFYPMMHYNEHPYKYDEYTYKDVTTRKEKCHAAFELKEDDTPGRDLPVVTGFKRMTPQECFWTQLSKDLPDALHYPADLGVSDDKKVQNLDSSYQGLIYPLLKDTINQLQNNPSQGMRALRGETGVAFARAGLNEEGRQKWIDKWIDNMNARQNATKKLSERYERRADRLTTMLEADRKRVPVGKILNVSSFAVTLLTPAGWSVATTRAVNAALTTLSVGNSFNQGEIDDDHERLAALGTLTMTRAPGTIAKTYMNSRIHTLVNNGTSPQTVKGSVSYDKQIEVQQEKRIRTDSGFKYSSKYVRSCSRATIKNEKDEGRSPSYLPYALYQGADKLGIFTHKQVPWVSEADAVKITSDSDKPTADIMHNYKKGNGIGRPMTGIDTRIGVLGLNNQGLFAMDEVKKPWNPEIAMNGWRNSGEDITCEWGLNGEGTESDTGNEQGLPKEITKTGTQLADAAASADKKVGDEIAVTGKRTGKSLNNTAGNYGRPGETIPEKAKGLTSFSVFSPVTIHVYDGQGSHTGINKNGVLEDEIQGVIYYSRGHLTTVAVPRHEDYRIEVEGEDTGLLTIGKRQFQETGITGYRQYYQIPVTPDTRGVIGMSASRGGFAYDYQGNGTYTKLTPDTVTNDPDLLSDDEQSPDTDITVEIDKNNDSRRPSAQITFGSTDDLSGVMGTQYRLDKHGSWNTYNNPITITESGTQTVYYRSVDYAANIEEVQTATFNIGGNESTEKSDENKNGQREDTETPYSNDTNDFISFSPYTPRVAAAHQPEPNTDAEENKEDAVARQDGEDGTLQEETQSNGEDKRNSQEGILAVLSDTLKDWWWLLALAAIGIISVYYLKSQSSRNSNS